MLMRFNLLVLRTQPRALVDKRHLPRHLAAALTRDVTRLLAAAERRQDVRCREVAKSHRHVREAGDARNLFAVLDRAQEGKEGGLVRAVVL